MNKTLEKAGTGKELTREDALELLAIRTGSADYYTLLGIANAEARTRFQDTARYSRRLV